VNIYRKYAGLATVVIFITLSQACVMGTPLAVKPALQTEVSGTYTLFLYGCKYPDDRENMAILVNEGGTYPLEIYAPNFMYTVKKGLPASRALAEAEAFVRCGFHNIRYTRFRMIPDNAGGAVGYELMPIYVPFELGGSEALLTNYSLKDGKVTAYIRPDVSLEREAGFSDTSDTSK